MPSHGRDDGLAPTLAVFAVLGAGLLALFAGYSWFWLVFVIGFAVVVPLVAILSSHDGRDRKRDQGRDDQRNDQRNERRDRVRDHGEHSWHGGRRDPWWQDVVDDDWWDDLATGSWWPDPERERERDREVRQRFGAPIDARTDADADDGAASDGRPVDTKTTARGDDEPPVDVQAALEELRARYARGDITDEQFDDELDRLLGRRDAGAEEREPA